MDDGTEARRASARQIDEVAAAAMPASVQELVEGWRCRSSPDLPFRRCRSVVPAPTAGEARAPFAGALAAVDRWSADHDQRLLVVVPSWLEHPDVVDAWLAEHGLEVEAPVEVLVRPLGGRGPTAGSTSGEVELATSPVVAARLDGDGRAQAYRRLLARHGDRALEVEASAGGFVVGRAFGVVDGGDVGVFGMAVDPVQRGRGIARALLADLLDAAVARGADRAYLQVEADNEAALALYRSTGFASHHRYRYRAAPRPLDTIGRWD